MWVKREGESFMGYVFISYSTQNQSMADAMNQLLIKNDIETWIAPDNIPGGQKYSGVIVKAIQECSCVLLMFSEVAQNSEWVLREIELAINYKKTVIPVQLENFIINNEFKWYLTTTHMIFVEGIDEKLDSIQKVIKSVREHTGSIVHKKNEEDSNTHKEREFSNLLKELYKMLDVFHFGVIENDKDAINLALDTMSRNTREVYEIGKRYEQDDREIYEKCINITEKYNAFIDVYTPFIPDLRNGRCSRMEVLGVLGDERLKKLQYLLFTYLCKMNGK